MALRLRHQDDLRINHAAAPAIVYGKRRLDAGIERELAHVQNAGIFRALVACRIDCENPATTRKIQVAKRLVVQQRQFMRAGDPDQGDSSCPIGGSAVSDGLERQTGKLQLKSDRLTPVRGENIRPAAPVTDADKV